MIIELSNRNVLLSFRLVAQDRANVSVGAPTEQQEREQHTHNIKLQVNGTVSGNDARIDE
jgi:hypothetical protein